MPYPTWEESVNQTPEEWKQFVEESFRVEVGNDRPLRVSAVGEPPFVTLSQDEYQDLRAMAHRCLFHQVLKVGLPIIPHDDFAYDQWAFLTSPDRLEVSLEIWESIRALKSPLEWHQFEDALGSTRK